MKGAGAFREANAEREDRPAQAQASDPGQRTDRAEVPVQLRLGLERVGLRRWADGQQLVFAHGESFYVLAGLWLSDRPARNNGRNLEKKLPRTTLGNGRKNSLKCSKQAVCDG